MPTDIARINECIEQVRKGCRDNAFCDLLDMGETFLPVLKSTFRSERDPHVRAFLVEVIWQHRNVSAIPFLAEALADDDPEVWQQALDGLVTMASGRVLDVLQRAKQQRLTCANKTREFRHWIDEAIEQVAAELQKK